MILSLAACTVPVYVRSFVAGDRCRQHLSLLDQRRDQPVADAVVLDALADGEDVGVRRLHVIVDDDAAVDAEPGLARQIHVRADAGGDDDEVGVDAAAVHERDAFGLRRAEDLLRAVGEQHPHAERFHLGSQIEAAQRIELPLHQRVHQMDDGDVAALHLQSARGFEAEKAAADDDGLDAGLRPVEQRARVVERAEREDAVLVDAFNRRHQRRASGGQEQRVEGGRGAVLRHDDFELGVDVDDAGADAEVDLVAPVPLQRVERDVVRVFFAGEHRRQQDAVVVDVGLLARGW